MSLIPLQACMISILLVLSSYAQQLAQETDGLGVFVHGFQLSPSLANQRVTHEVSVAFASQESILINPLADEFSVFGEWPRRYKGGAVFVRYTCSQSVPDIAKAVRQKLSDLLELRKDDLHVQSKHTQLVHRPRNAIVYDVHAHSMGGLMATIALTGKGDETKPGASRRGSKLPLPRAAFFYDVPWAGLTPTLRMAVDGLASMAKEAAEEQQELEQLHVGAGDGTPDRELSTEADVDGSSSRKKQKKQKKKKKKKRASGGLAGGLMKSLGLEGLLQTGTGVLGDSDGSSAGDAGPALIRRTIAGHLPFVDAVARPTFGWSKDLVQEAEQMLHERSLEGTEGSWGFLLREGGGRSVTDAAQVGLRRLSKASKVVCFEFQTHARQQQGQGQGQGRKGHGPGGGGRGLGLGGPMGMGGGGGELGDLMQLAAAMGGGGAGAGGGGGLGAMLGQLAELDGSMGGGVTSVSEGGENGGLAPALLSMLEHSFDSMDAIGRKRLQSRGVRFLELAGKRAGKGRTGVDEEEQEEEEALARDVGRKGGLGALEHAVAHVTAIKKHDAELWHAVLATVGAHGAGSGDGRADGSGGQYTGPGSLGSEEL